MKCFCTHAQAKNFGLLMLRFALGAVLIYHGWLKLSDIASTTMFFDGAGIPLAGFFAWIVGLVEFLGGLAFVLGVQTQTFAVLVSVTMVVALLTVHTSAPYAMAELPIMVLGGALALHGLGAGDWRLMKNECVCQMKK